MWRPMRQACRPGGADWSGALAALRHMAAASAVAPYLHARLHSADITVPHNLAELSDAELMMEAEALEQKLLAATREAHWPLAHAASGRSIPARAGSGCVCIAVTKGPSATTTLSAHAGPFVSRHVHGHSSEWLCRRDYVEQSTGG